MVAPRIQFDQEVCAVCGKETVGRCFMRVYLEPGRLEFCTPTCARVFNAESQRFGATASPRTEAFFARADGSARWSDAS